jgi:hypothetical protein
MTEPSSRVSMARLTLLWSTVASQSVIARQSRSVVEIRRRSRNIRYRLLDQAAFGSHDGK